MLRLTLKGRMTERDFGQGFNVDSRKTVGRSPGSAIQLLGVTVSREHCTVESVQGRYMLIRDLDSRNGTYLNGRKIRGEAKAHPGDEIGVGGFILTVEDPDAVEAAGAVTPHRARP